MRVDVREPENGVVVVDCNGPLVAGSGDVVFNRAVNELVAAGHKRILINLARVSRVDSSGIGELVSGMRLAARFGTSIKYLHLQATVGKVLEITRILPRLEVYDSEAAALEAFSVEPPAEPAGEWP